MPSRVPAAGEKVLVREPWKPQFHGRVVGHDLHPMQDSFIEVEVLDSPMVFPVRLWVNLRNCELQEQSDERD